MSTITVSLPSGTRCSQLKIAEASTVGDLKRAAQEALRFGILKLVTKSGDVLSNPDHPLSWYGLSEEAHVTAIATPAFFAATGEAFAMWCAGGDTLLTWCNPRHGGDTSSVQGQLKQVECMQSTDREHLLHFAKMAQ